MDYIDKDLIKIGLECQNNVEVISILGELLEKKGIVKETYTQAVIAREEIYPTGLPSNGIKVAIPHTDSSHVNKSAMAIAVLRDPVNFFIMGGTGEELDVRIVFLIAMTDPNLQLELLKKLMNLFQNQKVLQNIYDSQKEEEICEILKGIA